MGQMSRKNPIKKHRIEKILSERAPYGPHNVVLILDGLKPTFNIGKIFRTAQALGVRELCLVNIPFFDPYPAKGAFKQTRSRSFVNFEECYQALSAEDYQVFAMEPGGTDILGRFELPEKSAFVLGHEEFGLSFKLEDYPKIRTLQIPHWGPVQSMNVSVAASLALWEYCRLKQLDPKPEQV